LVTPDRALAGRVAAELLRWGIVADDSAGERLADAPPAVFLRLLAAALADGLGPVALLGLLKHPLAAAGLAPAACRAAARGLELACLRGPRPPDGLVGLRLAAAEAGDEVRLFVERVEACLAPGLRLAGVVAPPRQLLEALVAAGEALAATDERPGPARLWALEEGEALALLLAEALPVLAVLPDQKPAVLPGLLDALLDGAAVRSRRALRGREAAVEHPRVFIWGLLEARLQAADTVVLGGLAEGVWPPATDPGPWLSRPMRARAGLPSPEEAVGQAAHDFVSAACAAPRVVLSCPRRRDGAPAVPARWLARLDALLAPASLAVHPAAGWARLLDQPSGPPVPVRAPRPCPALHLRPSRLSVTEIETWLADPYAIHARRILRLEALKPLEQATDAADYGSLVHRGMQIFLADNGAAWPADALAQLRRAMDAALQRAPLRAALREWWRPRLYRIAAWVAEVEVARRSVAAPVALATEAKGDWLVDGFTLTGRADRIERRADGSLAILDYKTGAPPSQKEVEQGFAPQLPLEAAMAAAGAFGAEWRGEATALVYWQLTGGYEAGRVLPLFKGDPALTAASAADAASRLR
ncbi:MAG TPA: double-strand break repair protein AddB, partial [Acetobacteraceae bacterium]|nr:double-strand break repair protein AddB [Acetobacteraceae bacterium]